MSPYCDWCNRRIINCSCRIISYTPKPAPVRVTGSDVIAAKALGIRDTLGASLAKVAHAIAEAR